jgi:hypothetical protein
LALPMGSRKSLSRIWAGTMGSGTHTHGGTRQHTQLSSSSGKGCKEQSNPDCCYPGAQ